MGCKPKIIMNRGLLTKQDAAKLLNISEEELETLVASGKIPSYRIAGEFLRFKEADLYRYKSAALQPPRAVKITEKIADFFYFNDFYIISTLIIAGMLLVILR